MYNFIESKFLPKVSTKSAALDDYEVDNLISNNSFIKSRGFLGYISTKPPVDLEFTLICPVSIHYICLDTVLGTQRSTGIEILAGNSKSEFSTIARAVFDKEGVVFCNSRIYSRNNLPVDSNKYFVSFFRSNMFRTFLNADKLIVRIFRTERSVPCLAKIEVWGKVSKYCSAVVLNTIKDIVNQSSQLDSKPVQKYVLENVEFEIPEDFKDALTFDLMAIPMTLPSGHSVDQSTLEKCLANDNMYGRQASDPFTGLQYTSTRKPVLNVALKARIDMFLLQNSHKSELANVKRTVGRKRVLNEQDNYYNNNKRTFNNIQDSKDIVSSNSTLEEAIHKVMNSSNFIRFTENPAENIKTKCCELCKEEENMYVLPCEHLYCRKCLLQICKNLTCSTCKRTFLKEQAKRYHF